MPARRLRGPATTAAYLVLLTSPVFGLLAFQRVTLATWLETGMCPAGPMDRAAAPCGLFGILELTLLGGWAAFLVVPALLAWASLCSAGYLALRRWG